MSRRKERPSVLNDSADVVDMEINKRLLNANSAMNDVNLTPRGYKLSQKQEIADDLNWAVNIALDKKNVTGRFIVGKREDQDEEDAGIYLKPYDQQ